MKKALLLRLARKLDRVDNKQFNMGAWAHTERNAKGEPCGTVCCALGHGCSLPSFQKEGLSLQFNVYGDSDFGTLTLEKNGQSLRGFDAAAAFFGISWHDATFLFYEGAYGPRPSPATVAKRIRSFVKHGGKNPCELTC